MSKRTIEEIAREAAVSAERESFGRPGNLYADILDAIREAVANEREACAAIADAHRTEGVGLACVGCAAGAREDIAHRIRARGES